jgi:hypothetical protein
MIDVMGAVMRLLIATDVPPAPRCAGDGDPDGAEVGLQRRRTRGATKTLQRVQAGSRVAAFAGAAG